MVIAPDRLFVVTLQQKYKNIKTENMLKLAIAVLSLVKLSYIFMTSYHMLLIDKDNIVLIETLVQFTLFNTLAYTTESSYTAESITVAITDKEFSVFLQCADLSDESENA